MMRMMQVNPSGASTVIHERQPTPSSSLIFIISECPIRMQLAGGQRSAPTGEGSATTTPAAHSSPCGWPLNSDRLRLVHPTLPRSGFPHWARLRLAPAEATS